MPDGWCVVYHKFATKPVEALQLAVLDLAIDRFRSRAAASALERPCGLSQLRALFLGHLDWIAGRSHVGGCPFTGFVQEFDRRPGRLRDRLAAAQKDWRALLVQAARTAAGAGEISPRAEPDVIAFQLYGAALAYQIDLNLLDDGARGRERAIALLDRIASQDD